MFDLLKLMAQIDRAAMDKLSPPPPLAHGDHEAVVLATALEKFIGGGLHHKFNLNGSCSRHHRGWIHHLPLPSSMSTTLGLLVLAFPLHSSYFRDDCSLSLKAGETWAWSRAIFAVAVWLPEGCGQLLPCEDNIDQPQLLRG